MKTKKELIEEAINEFEEKIQVYRLCQSSLRAELTLMEFKK